MHSDGLFGICESGSNDNGNYIMFSDGTMICRRRITVNTVINTLWRNNIYDSPMISLGNYPLPFTDIPTLNITIESAPGGWLELINSQSKSYVGNIYIARPLSEDRTLVFIVNYIAIGRWK